MRNIVCKEPGVFEMRRTERPLRKPGEVLVKVSAVGVCGTDYHAFRGRQPYFAYPRILGHEIAGEVAETDGASEEAGGLKVGDRVTIMPYIACRACIACRAGRPNACSDLRVLGVHEDGAMREYLSVPAEYVVKTEGLSLNQTVIVEPMGIGLHAVNRGEIRPGETALVVGAGPIGLAAMKFAKLAGAKVIAMDTNAERLRFCRQWAGADEIVEAAGDAAAALADITGGDGPTTVFDATGSPQSMMKTFEYAAHGGKIVFVSLVQADISFHDPAFHKKELTLLGSRAATLAEFERVIACMREGRIDADGFITHRAPFEKAIEAFGEWLNPGSGVIKAVIEL
ncbi:zinc-binding alcohol dehydrogenase family protein [Cohnella hongkongensis]|uniref:Zinc-binding alcohol dehydrogenase family protein n=1 Tax=Cohnella hongkongensis TaxID=178337 RepID=A0ABV9F9C7_9BACL